MFDREPIGTIGAYDYDPKKSRIEVGMIIRRTSRGHGFATEALTAVLPYPADHGKNRTVNAWYAQTKNRWKSTDKLTLNSSLNTLCSNDHDNFRSVADL